MQEINEALAVSYEDLAECHYVLKERLPYGDEVASKIRPGLFIPRSSRFTCCAD